MAVPHITSQVSCPAGINNSNGFSSACIRSQPAFETAVNRNIANGNPAFDGYTAISAVSADQQQDTKDHTDTIISTLQGIDLRVDTKDQELSNAGRSTYSVSQYEINSIVSNLSGKYDHHYFALVKNGLSAGGWDFTVCRTMPHIGSDASFLQHAAAGTTHGCLTKMAGKYGSFYHLLDVAKFKALYPTDWFDYR